MKKINVSIIQLNFAVLLLGGTSLFSKLISLPAGQITFFRAVIGFIILLFLTFLNRLKFRLKDRNEYLIMIFTGFIMGLHWVTFFHSMQISSVAVGIVSLYTFPIFTAFIEPLIKKEWISFRAIIQSMITFGGVILIIPEFVLSNQITTGVLWGVLSALLFSVRNILVREKLSHIPGVVSMTYQLLVIFISLSLFFSPFSHSLFESNRLVLLIVLGVFFTALPHVLLVLSLKNLTATTTSFIACLQPLYCIIFAALILGEIPENSVIYGGVIIISAALYETYRIGYKRRS